MPLVKILQNYRNAEGWKAGDVVDITNPSDLISQNKVALVDESGNIISQDQSTAKKFIDRLGREEAANLAFDILRKLNLLDSLLTRPITKTATPETPKEVTSETESEKKTKKK